jgi:hypothetical protein
MRRRRDKKAVEDVEGRAYDFSVPDEAYVWLRGREQLLPLAVVELVDGRRLQVTYVAMSENQTASARIWVTWL